MSKHLIFLVNFAGKFGRYIMNMKIKIFVLLILSFVIVCIGDMMTPERRQDKSESVSICLSYDACIHSSENNIHRTINYILENSFADIPSQVLCNSSSYDSKSALKATHIILDYLSNFNFGNSSKIPSSLYVLVSRGVDYYVYTLKRILI